ncbi:rCG63030 [Rattus norvegicus]|uniref:RCG63030 n=1 Tax=Rattus norvegicus TaxID=10116 RepID=A6HWR7_RAT|nr:rCG63030 [Rattus norvegicus]
MSVRCALCTIISRRLLSTYMFRFKINLKLQFYTSVSITNTIPPYNFASICKDGLCF